MKFSAAIPLLIVLFYFNSFGMAGIADNTSISFYRVDLVCGAATDMGCGSRSKPVLIDLEKQSSIREAWLNRTGTVVAVVWEEGFEKDEALAKSVFKRHKLSIKNVNGEQHEIQSDDFANNKWYRGAEVDELSIEEAGRIADKVIDPLVKHSMLTQTQASAMHAEVEEYIKNEFLTLEDVSLLSTRAYYLNWEKNIQDIASKYMAAEDVAKIKIVGPPIWKRIMTYGGVILAVVGGLVIYRRNRQRKKEKITNNQET